MRVILLGTGNSVANVRRCGTGFLLEIGPDRIMIDCGPGTVRRLLEAGVNLADINYLFFTHHHLDHNLDFPTLFLQGGTAGRRTPLLIYGPTGTAQLTSDLFERGFAIDARDRYEDPAERQRVLGHQVREVDAGFSLQTPHWQVNTGRSDHFTRGGGYTVCYRFEAPAGIATFSGDTQPCPDVPKLAAGADVLFHEVCWMPEFVTRGTMPRSDRPYPQRDMTTWARATKHSLPHEVAAVAMEAGVRKLVLNHMQSDDQLDLLKSTVQAGFVGEVIVGEDLMVVEIGRG